MRRQQARPNLRQPVLQPELTSETSHALAMGTGEMYRVNPEDLDMDVLVHDLRGPISAIAIEMCLLLESSRTTHQDALEQPLLRVLNNVEFVERMLQDLLDACALDAGQFEMHVGPTNVRTLVHSVVSRVVTTPDRHRVNVEANETRIVLIDALRIERVLANLIQNAIKYSPPRTPITVRVEVLPDLTRVSVIDAGPGIRPSDTETIFEKYKRGPGARAHDGNGLGLYVSRQIIEAHGGRLEVRNVETGGSCFFFELPH